MSIIRGTHDELYNGNLISIINEADRNEVMELIQNIPAFKADDATWVEQNFFDIPYYSLVGDSNSWLCLILPTTQLGQWSKELDHDWIDNFETMAEWPEEKEEDDDEGFEGLGSLFG